MTTVQVLLLARARALSETGKGREQRLAARLSLSDVATAITGNVSTVHRWERGERRPTGEAAMRWAQLLDELADAR